MAKSHGNRAQQPRDADGRFESKNQNAAKPAAKGGMSPKGSPKGGDRCRDDHGRFEPCE